MKIHALSTQPHYWRHIRPIWDELPAELRGEVLDGQHPRTQRIDRQDVFLVAGYSDVIGAGERRTIYIEHGAGQGYVGTRSKHLPHYPGGEHPPNVIGYICPNEIVAESWRPRPAIAVGCPAVDDIPVQEGVAVVFTFHWDAPSVAPEARSARPHYMDHLHEMAQWVTETAHFGMYPLGHAHPRDKWAERVWKSIGVEFEPDPDVALLKAGLVIADNTSFAYEAALLQIPNVVLNAPWYRRHVQHGLRFWDHPPGLMVEDAYELISRPAIKWMEDPANIAIGEAAARRAYDLPPGYGGAKLASEFITNLVS